MSGKCKPCINTNPYTAMTCNLCDQETNDCTGIVQDSCVTCADIERCKETERKAKEESL